MNGSERGLSFFIFFVPRPQELKSVFPHLCKVPIKIHRRISGDTFPHPAPRFLEIDSSAACRDEANSRIPLLTQTKVIAKSLHPYPPACVHSPYKFIAASAAIPSRTPHPAPRFLEIDSSAACRDEAKSRIPLLTQTKVTASRLRPYFPRLCTFPI